MKSFAISKSGMQGEKAKRNLPWSIFLMTVMSATFGTLPGVQFMPLICHFEAQKVKNPMLQMVCDLELKWRSYNHCKQITPSWRKNFAQRCEITLLLRNDFTTFLHSAVDFPLKFPDTLEAEHRKLKSQLRSGAKSAVCCEVISQPFLCIYKISQTLFSPAKWSLVLPDICNRHFWIFFFRFLMSKSPFSPCNPPIIGFLSY